MLCNYINELRANVCTLVCTGKRPNTPEFDVPVHTERTRWRPLKASFWQLAVQVRRKGRYLSETFRRHADAEEWAIATERRIDRGETPKKRARVDPTTFGHLIDLHIDDLKRSGEGATPVKGIHPGRTSVEVGLRQDRRPDARTAHSSSATDRAKEGAGGVTVGMDVGYIKRTLISSHRSAAQCTGIEGLAEPSISAAAHIQRSKRLGLIGQGPRT